MNSNLIHAEINDQTDDPEGLRCSDDRIVSMNAGDPPAKICSDLLPKIGKHINVSDCDTWTIHPFWELSL